MNTDKTNLENNRANRLVNEKSPYLQQHAYNPVDWNPWDHEAIARSIAENKPILLSIGYSACHWCHVMEKESFEDRQTAEIMNRYFVNIKVDREERPDLDTIYMAAVSSITGRGGWPLNVFLSPGLKPFFGGTYFPPEDRFGMMSWKSILIRIAELWKDPAGRANIQNTAEDLTQRLQSYLSKPGRAFDELPEPTRNLLESAKGHYAELFDEKNGGFGPAPKFPSPVIQNFLLAYEEGKNTKEHEKTLKMAVSTLVAMAGGGIYDQLGGGFHRYATDAKWHVPHFEKMLYDNAQLMTNYSEAFVRTGQELFRKVAMETGDYLIRDMRDSRGGFYSAEDADSMEVDPLSGSHGHSEKKEGAFYVWQQSEFEGILGEGTIGSEALAYYFGVKPHGNIENDPNKEFIMKNILYKAHSIDDVSKQFGVPFDQASVLITESKEKLFTERNKRNRPGLDDKIITSWNGLAISALSRAFKVFQEAKYLHAARDASEFIWKNLYDSDSKKLFRRWRQGEKKVFGLCEDHAFLVQGLLDLFEADSDEKWLHRALELAETQVLHFYDSENGGFFMTGDDHDPHLIIRIKEENDNVLPGANSVSAMNLLRLGKIFNQKDFIDMAGKTINLFRSKMKEFPGSMPQMLVALQMFEREK